MREELASKKESGLDIENSQSFQISKDIKISKFTLRKVCCEEKAKDVAEHFARYG